MRVPSGIAALLFVLAACRAPSVLDQHRAVPARHLGVSLTAQQEQHFIHALTSTSWGDLESDLPHKLAPLHVFKSYFSMYELARTAYSLVLESPTDIARWRALAKLDSYADGASSSTYEAARREALTLNPRLFDHCPQFHAWSDSFRR